MTRRPAPCRQSDIVAAVKGARKAGLCVTGIECRRDGTVAVHGHPALDSAPKDAEPSLQELIAQARAENASRHDH